MSDWESMLNESPLDWLLEENNPSVRYFTLVDILGKRATSTEVKEAKQKIMSSETVSKILSKQKEGGYWVNRDNFYVYTKYKGTVWTFIILAELYADGNDDRIKRTCEFLLKNSQDRDSGGFSVYGNEEKGGVHEQVIPCLNGNMIWALITFGYLDNPRIRRSIDWIIQYQRLDDGIDKAPKGWPYEKHKNCWGNHTCLMGVVKSLKALTEVPLNKRSIEINNFIQKAVEFILEHRIYKKSHERNTVAKAEWTQFGFPLLWKTDALEILNILTKLRYKDDRMQDAIDLVLSKQTQEGKWRLEKSFNGRVQVNFEQEGKESKWITLNAVRALKRYYS